MSVKYEISQDGKQAKRIVITETTISIEEKEALVKKLKDELKNLPEQKTRPDEETLEFWNRQNQKKRAMLESFIQSGESELQTIKDSEVADAHNI